MTGASGQGRTVQEHYTVPPAILHEFKIQVHYWLSAKLQDYNSRMGELNYPLSKRLTKPGLPMSGWPQVGSKEFSIPAWNSAADHYFFGAKTWKNLEVGFSIVFMAQRSQRGSQDLPI